MMGSLRALAIVMTLAPALALAQPTQADKQKASELVKKAITKSQAGDHEAAVELYQSAYKLIPQPLLLSNIGNEYQQMKKPVEARTFFCKYLEADPTGNNVSYATAQAKSLYLELSGATSVDEKDVCKPIVKATQPPVPTATVTQPEAPPVAPVDKGPKPKPNVMRYAGIGVLVLGGIGFGLGSYYGMQAQKISDDITNHPITEPWRADIKAYEAEGQSDENKQIGLMIGGGVVMVAGVVMIFVSTAKAESPTGVSFAPIATHDTVGFAAAGHF